MTIGSVADVVAAFNEGRFRMSVPVRKTPTITSSPGLWTDTTMLAGSPLPSYYASTPLAFAPMARSTHGGWDHGSTYSGYTKYLKRLDLHFGTAGGFGSLSSYLVDVLGYYPFIDEGAPGEEQVLDNTVAKPARWGDGKDVKLYAVSVAASGLIAGNSLTVTYTNSDGVAGRVTTGATLSVLSGAVNNAAILSSGPGQPPWLPLQGLDSGVQTVESVRIDGPGDTGLLTLVACRVVATPPVFVGRSSAEAATAGSTFVEHDFLRTQHLLPKIDDDAFLSMVGAPVLLGSAAASFLPVFANFDVIWG